MAATIDISLVHKEPGALSSPNVKALTLRASTWHAQNKNLRGHFGFGKRYISSDRIYYVGTTLSTVQELDDDGFRAKVMREVEFER